MGKLDPDLLATFARRSYVAEADSPEAESHAVEEWIGAGCPDVDGLSKEDRELLEARPLTVRLAARRERVSERTVYRWLRSGELEGHRVGRGWRIPPEALDSRRIEAAKPKPRPAVRKRRARRKAAPAAPSKRVWPA